MEAVRAFAFALPEAWEDHPWGESVAKVGKKVFVFMGMGESDDGTAHFTVKLPESHQEALSLPFSETPGYGLTVDIGSRFMHRRTRRWRCSPAGWRRATARWRHGRWSGSWTADDAAYTPPRMLNPNPPRMITVVAAVALILVGMSATIFAARLRECRA